MGEALYINVFHRLTDEEGERADTLLPVCTIVRTCDIQQAYDAAIALVDDAVLVSGSYDGMPANEYNGTGHFAKALLAHINEDWEIYTFLGAVPDADGEGDWGGEDMVLNIVCDDTGKPTHDLYELATS